MRTSNLRNWWRSVKLVTGLKTIEPPLSGLANQILDGDMHALANSVNACFQSVAADLSPLDNKDLPLPPDILPSDFSISINDVERKLSQINIHEVPGPDGLPNWILRDFSAQFAGPLSVISNGSVHEGFITTR